MPKTAQKDASVATVKKQGAVMKHIKKYWQWYAMMLIPVVYYIVFRYIPMVQAQKAMLDQGLLGDVLYTRAVIPMEKMRKSAQEAILWPWFAICDRICIDATGLGIGWSHDAQDKFGKNRVEAVNFSGPVKEALAYPLRGAMEDRTVRIPEDPKIRADLRKVQKTTTAAGNIRFVADSDDEGHADRADHRHRQPAQARPAADPRPCA
mgnify:CR=1 FL=1